MQPPTTSLLIKAGVSSSLASSTQETYLMFCMCSSFICYLLVTIMYTPPGPVEFQIGRWPGIKPILPVATVYPQTIERRAATSPRRLPVAIQAGVGKEARGAGATGNRRYNLIECREQNRKFL